MSLFDEVAAHLAGRPVLVRFQHPVFDFCSGCAYKSRDNRAIVDVDPAGDVLKVLLHELAHIKKDWPDIAPGDDWQAAPGSLTYNPQVQAMLSNLPREPRADQLAQEWLTYAEKYYPGYPAASEIESKLKCLVDYPMAELRDSIKQAAERGAAAAVAAWLKNRS
jgi:hypothetical protein